MRLGVLAILAMTACSLPKFHGTAGDDDSADAAGGDGHLGSGHDEDKDGMPDLLDPCPTDPDTTLDGDPDGDGIGERCDPDPGSGADMRFLYTFETGTGDLQASSPADQGNDEIAIGNATNGVRQVFWVPRPFGRVHIELGYHVYAVGDGTAPGVNYEELTVHTTHVGAESSLAGEGCSVEQFLQSNETHFYVESVDASGNGTEHDHMDFPGEPPNNTDGRLILDEVGGNLVCTLVRDGHASSRIMQNIGSNTGQVGFSAIQMRVGIKYLFVAGL